MSLASFAARVVAVVVVTWVPLVLALGARLDGLGRRATAVGAVVAALNAVAAYGLVCWGGKRSPRAFLAAVLGGMVARMGAMLAAVVAAVVGLGLPKLPLALTLLAYFVGFLVFEIAVLQRRTAATETR